MVPEHAIRECRSIQSCVGASKAFGRRSEVLRKRTGGVPRLNSGSLEEAHHVKEGNTANSRNSMVLRTRGLPEFRSGDEVQHRDHERLGARAEGIATGTEGVVRVVNEPVATHPLAVTTERRIPRG